MTAGREFKRTRQGAFGFLKKRPCKDMLRAGITLAFGRQARGITTAQLDTISAKMGHKDSLENSRRCL